MDAREWRDAAVAVYGDAQLVMKSCVRSIIQADHGKLFNCVDFSSIEARGLAWLAGEEDVLDVFRSGQDIYCYAATKIYGYPVNKKDHPDERQVGKTSELACGYQGSVGAFQTFARAFGIEIEDERALEIVKAWRAGRPLTTQYWKDLETAACAAVGYPGETFQAGHPARPVTYRVSGSFLICTLPSGRDGHKRRIIYPYPEIKMMEAPWSQNARREWDEANEKGEAEGDKPEKEYKSTLTYHGADSKNNYHWGLTSTYGGKLAENVTQAVCRDILVEAMHRLDDAGFTLLLTTHDELLCEEDGDRLAEMTELTTIVPPWAEGLPIHAAGWAEKTYRKD